jgi:hypothetical protein
MKGQHEELSSKVSKKREHLLKYRDFSIYLANNLQVILAKGAFP